MIPMPVTKRMPATRGMSATNEMLKDASNERDTSNNEEKQQKGRASTATSKFPVTCVPLIAGIPFVGIAVVVLEGAAVRRGRFPNIEYDIFPYSQQSIRTRTSRLSGEEFSVPMRRKASKVDAESRPTLRLKQHLECDVICL